MRRLFSEYGRVLNVVIPRDRTTGRLNNYGFIQFSSEEEAARIHERCQTNKPRLHDVLITVSWAYSGKADRVYSPSRYPAKHSHSRSRSPKRHPDWRSRSDLLLRKIEDLRREKDQLHDELKKSEKKLRDAKAFYEEAKNELGQLRNQTKLFLPCGHHKKVQARDKEMLDEQVYAALGQLEPSERCNEILVRQLKARVFYILEAKQPDVFRCRETERIVIDDCGHAPEMECWQIREFQKGTALPPCKELTDKQLACGHFERVQCSKAADQVVCKQC